jgi:60 kDa SS-A/Ro ribonucleoprotein
MSKFNKTAPRKSASRTFNSTEINKTTNYEGGEAFTIPAKERLASRVMTSLINEKKFYGDNTDALLADIKAVAKVDPLFILKLAAYTRNVMHFRSSPIFTLVHASLIEECKPFIRQWAPKIIQRADEPAEAISLINSIFEGGKPIVPNSLKKGIGDSLKKFDAYALMKYKGTGGNVNLYDVFNVTHPKPETPEMAALWKDFINGKLAPAETWETTLSQEGSSAESWEKIIPKMGYMALMRNLRNFVKARISKESVEFVASVISDKEKVLRSKQLPFRFFAAYYELSNLVQPDRRRFYFASTKNVGEYDDDQRKVIHVFRDALAAAFEHACSVNSLEGTTAVFADTSGSMNQSLSERSSLMYADVAFVLAAMASEAAKNKSEVSYNMLFSSNAVQVDNHGLSPMQYINKMRDLNNGGATNGYLCFQHILKNKIKLDRVILVTDCELYSDSYKYHREITSIATASRCNGWRGSNDESIEKLWDEYRSKVNPNATLHMVDLAGHGTTPAPLNQKGVALYAGWTDKFLELIELQEKGVGSMIQDIENYNI